MNQTQAEVENLTDLSSELTLHEYTDFVRDPLPGESERDQNRRKLRYCTFADCSYNTGVISNLRKHLLKRHRIQTAGETSRVRSSGSQELQDLYLNSDHRTRHEIQSTVFSAHLNKDVVRKALVRFIVQQRLALSIVERPSFHTFVQALNPLADETIVPVSHSAIRTAIQSHWYEEKLILQRELQTAASKINISLDIWTSPNRILFLAIVAHFVRHDSGHFMKSLLALRQVGGHSGEEQFTVLRTVLEEYEISRNLGAIIGDNATTNDTLCRTIAQWYSDEFDLLWEPEKQRIRCLGHIINLIAQAFLFSGSSTVCSLRDLEIADQEEQEGIELGVVRQGEMRSIGPMGKLHNIVVHIRSSGLRTKEFISKSCKMIPLDNRTRWNSWYTMISTAISLEMHIDFYVKNQPDLQRDILESKDWELLRTTAAFLKMFKDICLGSEGDGKSLSSTLPSLWILRWHIMAFLDKHKMKAKKTDFDQDCVVRAEEALLALEKWWNLLWDHPLYQLAVILHPYFRTNWIQETMKNLKIPAREQKQKLQWIKQLWLDFVEECKKKASYEERSDQRSEQEQRKGKRKERARRNTAFLVQQAQDRSIESLNERIFGNWTSSDMLDEWEEYCAEPSLKGIKNLLEWWQDSVRRERWPLLSQLAMEIHSIPPMSDEPERVFSGGRRTITWERSRLSAETIEVTECLQHWLSQRIKG